MHVCLGHAYEHVEERQKRRRKEQIRKALQTLSSTVNNIGLKLTSAHFETTGSGSHEKFEILLSSPTTDLDGDSDNGSITATINYLMLKHGVPISFYHELSKQFKKLPRTHEVLK